MSSDVSEVRSIIVVLVTTYWLHSTLLLATVWLLERCRRLESHALVEWLWKSAALLSLLTAVAQACGGFSGFIVNLSGHSEAAAEATQSGPENRFNASRNVSVGFAELRDRSSDPPGRFRTAAPRATALQETFFPAGGLADRASDPYRGRLFGGAVGPDDLNDFAAPASGARTAETELERPITIVSAVPEDRNTNRNQSLPVRLSALTPAISILGAAALLLIVLGSIRLLGQSILFRRSLSTARVESTGSVRNTLDALLERVGISRTVTLLRSPQIPAPVAFGLHHWQIVLPDGIEQKLQPAEIRALLSHELAHLVRGDTLWLWIGRVLCTCFAFQPLNLLARRRWQRAAEYDCDRWAVTDGGASPVALARCLTRFAEWQLSRPAASVALSVGGPPSTLSRRIEQLLDGGRTADSWRTRRGKRLLLAATTAGACAMICCGPRTALPDQTPRAAIGDGGGLTTDDSGNAAGEPAPAPATVDGDLERVHIELVHLERQLERVQELLDDGNPTGEIQELAKRLRIRADAIRRRTAHLGQIGTREPRSSPGGELHNR